MQRESEMDGHRSVIDHRTAECAQRDQISSQMGIADRSQRVANRLDRQHHAIAFPVAPRAPVTLASQPTPDHDYVTPGFARSGYREEEPARDVVEVVFRAIAGASGTVAREVV